MLGARAMGQVIGKWADRVLLAEHLADFFAPPGGKESSAQTISGRVAMIIHPFRRRLWAKSFIEMNQMCGANTSTLTTLPTFWDVEEDTEDTRILTHTLIIDILLSYDL